VEQGWEGNIKMDIREKGFRGVHWIIWLRTETMAE
jgi:hypothetical protein